MIDVQRVYDHIPPDGRPRYLVERLWPRGTKKEALALTAWVKEVAPSPDLRRWYAHDPAKWAEFRSRYYAELDANAAAWQPLLEAARRGDIVFLYAASDRERNSAMALRDYLVEHGA